MRAATGRERAHQCDDVSAERRSGATCRGALQASGAPAARQFRSRAQAAPGDARSSARRVRRIAGGGGPRFGGRALRNFDGQPAARAGRGSGGFHRPLGRPAGDRENRAGFELRRVPSARRVSNALYQQAGRDCPEHRIAQRTLQTEVVPEPRGRSAGVIRPPVQERGDAAGVPMEKPRDGRTGDRRDLPGSGKLRASLSALHR